MKQSKNRQNFLGIIILGLLLAMAIPATALGQGHGRGRSNGIGRNGTNWPNRSSWPNYGKKCGKFVNCHDASEGRVDGRGPRSDRFSNILGTRVRHRNRRFGNNNLVFRNRQNRDARNNFLRNRGRRVSDNH
ncbi:MAG TPA: hypothetical protein DCK93_04565 [Blastocatellia bacterium]|jgi:hypothetical protein|nr:hypothetical protein [Blastocatellia bacterium]HAF22178.1 hypothetical protein [Blastocatellia bacterium]